MMRVLNISSEDSWRGGEQQIAYLISGANDVDHYVYCRENSPFEEHCRESGISFRSGSFHPLMLLNSASRVRKYCEDKSIDLVHCHTGKAHLLAYFALLTGLKTPVVASRRIATPPSDFVFTRMRYDHPGVRRIICVSEDIQKTMEEYLRSPEKALTIHSGIDAEKFQKPSFDLHTRLGIAKSRQIAGTIAALTEEKDLDTFLEAARIVLNEGFDVHFIIVGEGDLREQLIRKTTELSLETHVTFTGYVDNPLDYLQQFDLFLLTSRNEGLGTSILDAFACNVPVIASRTGGIPELVQHGETGLLAGPGAPGEFAAGIIRLLENPPESKSITRNARESLAKFTYEEMVRKTEQCYRRVLEEYRDHPDVNH